MNWGGWSLLSNPVGASKLWFFKPLRGYFLQPEAQHFYGVVKCAVASELREPSVAMTLMACFLPDLTEKRWARFRAVLCRELHDY